MPAYGTLASTYHLIKKIKKGMFMYTLSNPRLLAAQLLVVLAFLLSGCAQKLENINDYNLLKVSDESFSLPITYGLPLNSASIPLKRTIRFYLEGDGRAWLSKKRPSSDPTPSNSLVLKLMQIDKTPAIYLARPCQYHLNEKCKQYYWTEGRHDDVAVTTMNDAISKIKKRYDANFVELFGHSGGGAMAVLIAAKRSDVKGITTVAANLDVPFFTKHHKITEMKGSLNPIDVADKIKNIPQLHLAGGQDKVIPPFLIKRYISKSASPCVAYEEFSGNSHHQGWIDIWLDISQRNTKCTE
ncbi:MAG: hypothetical protein ACI9TY_000548 [Alphaproteobacteria bacterium]